mmetsp:Transcript_8477/g.22667  ORF Transcript_8477/g.22667 Transcript_8477/m.22667 type:complete len:102 (-) Transcript_8477:395-700(-)
MEAMWFQCSLERRTSCCSYINLEVEGKRKIEIGKVPAQSVQILAGCLLRVVCSRRMPSCVAQYMDALGSGRRAKNGAGVVMRHLVAMVAMQHVQHCLACSS